MAFGTNLLHANATINRYIRKQTLAIARKQPFLAALMSKKRVMYGVTGKLQDWKVRVKRTPMITFDDGDSLTFSRQEKHKTAQLPMRSYVVTKAIYKGDKLMNGGNEAIVPLAANAVSEAMDDIKNQFAQRLWQIDGNATGYDKQIHGIPSATGATDNGSSSIVGTNADTYAGLSTVRGNFGGAWTGTWPDGYGDPQYAAWSPLIVDYSASVAESSGGWSATTKTWPNTCIEAIRFAIIMTACNEDSLDNIYLAPNLYRQLLNAAQEEERLVVNRMQDSTNTKLGFRGINIDGVDVLFDPDIPAGKGYGINFDSIELWSYQKQLFVSETSFNHEKMADRVSVDFYGNLGLKSLRGLVQFTEL